MNKEEVVRALDKSYLDNVRMIEFACDKLGEKSRSLEKQIKTLGISKDIEKPSMSIDSSDNLSISAGGFVFFLFAAIAYAVAESIKELLGWLLPSSWVNIFYFFAKVLVFIGFCLIVGGISGLAQSSSNQKKYYKFKVTEYEKAIIKDRERVEKENDQKEQLLKSLKFYHKKFDEADRIRCQLYSENIIPQEFRNIHAIYYLYSYLATSKQNLEQALLHCSLNKIQQQLNVLIQQNNEIIYSLSEMHLKYSDMKNQNNELFNMAEQRLANIERNQHELGERQENSNRTLEFFASSNFWNDFFKK